ncbi:MAG: diguanylate cyclase [Clostridia bacterium]|nr:diguanylate cyclase [Clostridia bacterium]
MLKNFFSRIKYIFVFDKSGVADFETVKSQIMQENRKFAIIWSAVQIMFWTFSLFMSTRDELFARCQSIYVVVLVICTATLLLSTFAAPKFPWLIRPLSFLVEASFLGAGVGIALFLAPKTIVIFVSAVLIPIIFISDLLSNTIVLTLDIVVFSILGSKMIEPEIFKWTLSNLIIFSVGGIIVGYFVNKTRFERYVFAESAVRLAESSAELAKMQTQYAYYDQMTGLKNRRAFSEKEAELSKEMPAYCCVVFADINGLKEMNDTMGHDAGDELIIGAAECLNESFEGIDTVYRIGGDEFCVILTDETVAVEPCLKILNEKCAAWKGEFINGFSISYGYAFGEDGLDFDSVQREADRKMYSNKNDFYRNTGKDRRNH